MHRKATHLFALIDQQEAHDKPHLAAHGLDKPLRRDWGEPNHMEIERQAAYLLENWRAKGRGNKAKIPPLTVKRRACQLLGCYLPTGVPEQDMPVPPIIVRLIGDLLEVGRHDPASPQAITERTKATAFVKDHPAATQAAVAKAAGVSRRTISDWYSNGWLDGWDGPKLRGRPKKK